MFNLEMVISTIINIVFMLFSIRFFMNTFFEKAELSKIANLFSIGIAVQQIINTLYLNPIYNMLANILLFAGFCIFAYNGKKAIKLIFSVLFLITCGICEILVVYLFFTNGIQEFNEMLLGSIISKVFFLIFVYLIRVTKNSRKIYRNFYRVGVVGVPVLSLVLLFIASKYPRESNVLDDFMIIILCIIGITNVLMLVIFELVFREVALKNENNTYLQQLELKKEHNRELEALSENARKLNHNIRNYFITIRELAYNSENEKIEEYINDIFGSESFKKEISDCGIAAIDTIINVKNIEIEKANIKFNLSINIPSISMFSQSDISVLLGNLLDNAIEANKNVSIDDRFIKLNISLSETYVLITCVNSHNNNIKKNKNGLLNTGKEDKQNHGYGLISIKNICEKYDGRFNFEYDDTQFTAKCMLLIKE